MARVRGAPAPRTQEVEIPYYPRPLQRVVHSQLRRWNVLVTHRRFGKTVLAINEVLRRAAMCPHPNPRLAILSPTYGQAKRTAWDYAKQYALPIPGVKFSETELRIDFGTARLYLLGAENPDSLRGMYLDFCVLDEYADQPPRVFPEIIVPALSDRQGGALWLGTPRGHNHFFTAYEEAARHVKAGDKDWYCAVFRASETGILPQEELDRARSLMSKEQYDQEYECSWSAAIMGSYYGRLMQEALESGRVGNVPHIPSLPVHTAWDLGLSSRMAVWFFQKYGGAVHVIDYYENHEGGLVQYIEYLDRHGRDKNYLYGTHWGPHDLNTRDIGLGKSRYELAASLGVRFRVLPKLPVADGIEAARMLIPRCWFNQETTKQGVAALRHYHQVWDEDRRVFMAAPFRDWASHAADAFRYLAVACDQGALMPSRDLPAMAEMDYSLFGER